MTIEIIQMLWKSCIPSSLSLPMRYFGEMDELNLTLCGVLQNSPL